MSLSDDISKIIDAQLEDIPRSRWIIRILESTHKQNNNTTKLGCQRKGNREDSLETQIGLHNQVNLFRQSQPSNQNCEAIGCSAQATERIQVKVGEKGTICLYLCSSCVGKFARG